MPRTWVLAALAVVALPVIACGGNGESTDGSGSGTTSTTQTVPASLPADPVAFPGAQASSWVPTHVRSGPGADSECYALASDPFPSHVWVDEIDGSVAVASVVNLIDFFNDRSQTWPDPRVPEIAGRPTLGSHTVSSLWKFPEPGNRVVVDLGGSEALVVGSIDLEVEALAELAEEVLSSGTPTAPAGSVALEVDDSVEVLSTAWAPPGSEAALSGCGTPVWILTLHNGEQLEALREIGSPELDGRDWLAVENVPSNYLPIGEPARAVEAMGVEGELMTLTARTRALLLPTDPPVAVLSGNCCASVDDNLIVAVARSLRFVGRSELGVELDALRAAVEAISTTTTTELRYVESTTTSTTSSPD